MTDDMQRLIRKKQQHLTSSARKQHRQQCLSKSRVQSDPKPTILQPFTPAFADHLYTHLAQPPSEHPPLEHNLAALSSASQELSEETRILAIVSLRKRVQEATDEDTQVVVERLGRWIVREAGEGQLQARYQALWIISVLTCLGSVAEKLVNIGLLESLQKGVPHNCQQISQSSIFILGNLAAHASLKPQLLTFLTQNQANLTQATHAHCIPKSIENMAWAYSNLAYLKLSKEMIEPGLRLISMALTITDQPVLQRDLADGLWTITRNLEEHDLAWFLTLSGIVESSRRVISFTSDWRVQHKFLQVIAQLSTFDSLDLPTAHMFYSTLQLPLQPHPALLKTSLLIRTNISTHPALALKHLQDRHLQRLALIFSAEPYPIKDQAIDLYSNLLYYNDCQAVIEESCRARLHLAMLEQLRVEIRPGYLKRVLLCLNAVVSAARVGVRSVILDQILEAGARDVFGRLEYHKNKEVYEVLIKFLDQHFQEEQQ